MNANRSEAFVEHLRKLVDPEADSAGRTGEETRTTTRVRDRAARATLRRSLAFPPGAYERAFRYVEPFVTTEEGWRREAFYLLAGLFALCPKVGEQSLASAFGELCRGKSKSLEARFLALLDSDRDQLPDRLRRAVALLSDGPGLDWSRLLDDLLYWFRPDRKVQRAWAREFYRAMSEAMSEPGDEQPAAQGPTPGELTEEPATGEPAETEVHP